MKNPDPNIVEVTLREGAGFRKSNMGNPESRFLSKETRAKSANSFFVPHREYSFRLLIDGFCLRIKGIDDRIVRKANRAGQVCVGGVEPGFYDIVEQTEDYIIAKKQK